MPDLGPAHRFEKDMIALEEGLIKSLMAAYARVREDLLKVARQHGVGSSQFQAAIKSRLLSFKKEIRRIIRIERDRLNAIVDKMTNESLDILREFESDIPSFTALESGSSEDRTSIFDGFVLAMAVIVAAIQAQMLAASADASEGDEEIEAILSPEITNGRASAFRRGGNRLQVETQKNLWQTAHDMQDAYYSAVESAGLKLQKQAVATVDKKTTRTCLRVHGQIKDIGEPFSLDAEPRFSSKKQHPPFHWNCRTVEAPYLPVLERLGPTTPEMIAQARAELGQR